MRRRKMQIDNPLGYANSRSSSLRDHRSNSCAISIRLNLQRAPEFSHALAHTAESYSVICSRRHGRTSLYANTLPLIANLQSQHFFIGRPYLYSCRLAARMTINVGQTFLHDSKNRNLHFGCKPAEFRREFNSHLYAATLCKTIGKQLDRGQEPDFVKKRRMKQMRNSTYFF